MKIWRRNNKCIRAPRVAARLPQLALAKRSCGSSKSRRGSAAVLLTVIFISIVSALSVICELASQRAAENTSDGALDNAGRVILSCYDKELQERYGIFGFEMDEAAVEKNTEKLLKETFSAMPLKKSEIESVSAECSAYSLSEPENLKLQITELMKYKSIDDAADIVAEGLVGVASGIKNKDDIKRATEDEEAAMDRAEQEQKASAAEGGSSSSGETTDFASIRNVHKMLKKKGEEAKNREAPAPGSDSVLRNRRIRDSLPSVTRGADGKGAFSGTGIFSVISSGAEGLTSLYEDFMIAQYAADYFKNHSSGAKTGFFQNEMEYILYGNMSDKANYRRAYAAIFAVREAMNAAYLFTDTAKRGEALTMAEALTPGPWATLTQYIILTAWSALETLNDMKNLEAGNGVPLAKNSETWAVTLSSLLEEGGGNGYIRISGNSVMTYENYLKLLMMTEDQEVKLLRIMDLIQINMKGSVREEFLIADHFTGAVISVDAKKKSVSPYVRGRTLSISQAHSYLQ